VATAKAETTLTSILTSTPSASLKLWQPPKSNSARRTAVPKLLMGILSLRAVAATNVDRVAPALLFAITSALPTSITPSFAHDPLRPITCPPPQEKCGHHICFDPTVSWCCPDNLNICLRTEGCAKADTGSSNWIYGCGPLDHKPGNNSDIHTTSVHNDESSTSTARATVTTTPTVSSATTTLATSATGSMSLSASTSLAKPTGSGGRRINVPGVVSNLFLLIRGARAVIVSPPATTTTIATTATPSFGRRTWGDPYDQFITCAKGQDSCGKFFCYDMQTQACCPDYYTVCPITAHCVAKSDNKDYSHYECALPDGTNTTGSPILPAPTSQPGVSGGERLGVPSIVQYIALLVRGARAVIAPPPTTTTGSTLLNRRAWPYDPSSIHTCPEGQIVCGSHGCYNSKMEQCCLDYHTICPHTIPCAYVPGLEPGTNSSYICAPPHGSNGTGSVGLSTPIGHPAVSGTTRIGVPSVVKYIALLVRSAQALALPSPLRPECCGDICCNMDEVCTRSSTGPKCWPKAGQRAGRSNSGGEVSTTSKEITAHPTQTNDMSKQEQPGNLDEEELTVHTNTAGAARDVPKEGSAARPATPKLFALLLFLMSFVAGDLAPSLPLVGRHLPVAGIPQADLSTKAMSKRLLLGKRWSCHKPNQNCGSSGCWDPAEHSCCNRPDGKYGLCSASKGEACCGTMCCSKNTECRNDGDYLCFPKNPDFSLQFLNKTSSAKAFDSTAK
jgi:hypothetical protein